MADRKSYPQVKLRAKELRKTPTPTEQILWMHLRNRKLCGFKFRRQHPIGPFIADFYCAQHKLVVELDGNIHRSQVDYDSQRMEYLEAYGYQVLRVGNEAVEKDLESVLNRITLACEVRSPSPESEEGETDVRQRGTDT